MSGDKVISVVSRGDVKQVLYKEKVIGVLFQDASDVEIAAIFESCLDELLERQNKRMQKELPEKLVPILQKFVDQAYAAGRQGAAPPRGIVKQMVDLFL